MAEKPQQLTEPLDLPSVEALCEAVNAANAAWRAYFKSCGIAFEEDFFSLVEHPRRSELLEAAFKYRQDYMHNIPALAAKKTKGPVQ